MSHRVAIARRRLGQGLVLALMLGAAGPAPNRPALKIYEDPAQIQKLLPTVHATDQGVFIRARNGRELQLTERAFLGSPPVLCWYAPALHVLGACEFGHGTAITILINLNTGRRTSAPGVASLAPEPGLIVVGPRAPDGPDADSITLVRATPDDLEDQGGALFDKDHLPGAWVDAGCYRLGAKGDWLEKTPQGWRQVTPQKSTVCRQRHGG